MRICPSRPEEKSSECRSLSGPFVAAEGGVAILDTRLARIRTLLLLNLCLQALDGWVTYAGMGYGFLEGNPLVAALMTSLGVVWALAASKALAVALLVALYRKRESPLVEPGLLSLAAAYTFLAVGPWTILLASNQP